MKLNYTKIKNVKSPSKGTDKSAGIDFYIPNELDDLKLLEINPGESSKIPSGLKIKIPNNFCLVAFNKSGVAVRGLVVGACVVDEDYQGEVHLHVINTTKKSIKLNLGEKLCQFLLIPTYTVVLNNVEYEELFSETSERGVGGFGSTGLN